VSNFSIKSVEPSKSRYIFLTQLASNTEFHRGEIIPFNIGLVVHMAVTMKSTIFCDVLSHKLIEVYRRFGGTHCLDFKSRRVSQVIKRRV
jgi:hypothetical protein